MGAARCDQSAAAAAHSSYKVAAADTRHLECFTSVLAHSAAWMCLLLSFFTCASVTTLLLYTVAHQLVDGGSVISKRGRLVLDSNW